MDSLLFVVSCLAVWRLTSLISSERGPFDIFVWFRGLFGIDHNDDGIPNHWPEKFPANLIVCPWCLSIWVGSAYLVGTLLFPTVLFYFSLPFAYSAVTVIVHSFVGKE